jgi:hypothetical protein
MLVLEKEYSAHWKVKNDNQTCKKTKKILQYDKGVERVISKWRAIKDKLILGVKHVKEN